ncbi:MAG: hypothetical protein WA843_01380 [Candidatus Saccharimonadales bacterium]
MSPDNVDPPLVLVAKDNPCECHACIPILCFNCKKLAYQTIEKMDIYFKNKDRSCHLCRSCLEDLKQITRDGQLVEVKLDEPVGGNN